jgi:hypothetical protein
MEYTKFSSPREEVLNIAYQTRRDILSQDKNAVIIVRACLVTRARLLYFLCLSENSFNSTRVHESLMELLNF